MRIIILIALFFLQRMALAQPLYTEVFDFYTQKYIQLDPIGQSNKRINPADEPFFNTYKLLDTTYANTKKVNGILHYLLVDYLNSDTFQFENLRRAQAAAKIYLNRNVQSQYQYSNADHQNTKNQIPSITNIDYTFPFMFDGLLAVQSNYTCKLNDISENDELTYNWVKTYFINLNTGKLVDIESLFRPEKKGELLSELNQQIARICMQQAGFLERPDENFTNETDEDEEGELVQPEKKDSKGNTQLVNLKHILFGLNPISGVFVIPGYSEPTTASHGFGLQILIPLKKLKTYINPTGALKNLIVFQVPETTTITNFNPIKEWQTPYRIDKNREFDAFEKAPKIGIKEVHISIAYHQSLNHRDTIIRKHFLPNGLMDTFQYLDEGGLYDTYQLTYSPKGKLMKLYESSREGFENQTEYFTDKLTQNIVLIKDSNNEGNTTQTHYQYSGNRVYVLDENPLVLNEVENSMQALSLMELTDFGHIKHFEQFGLRPNYQNTYEKDLLLGSKNLFGFNQESTYEYIANGQIKSINQENGRYLNIYQYDAACKLIKVLYYESDYLRNTEEFTYRADGFLQTQTITKNIYSGGKGFDNQYQLTFEYTFY